MWLGEIWKEREKKHYCWWLEPALAGFLVKRESCNFAAGRKEEEIRIRAVDAGKMQGEEDKEEGKSWCVERASMEEKKRKRGEKKVFLKFVSSI